MRSFLGVPTLNYIGVPYSIPMDELAKNASAVATQFNWTTYFGAVPGGSANIGVNVNMQSRSSGVIAADWKIRSVYVDNTNSIATIYVNFFDTGYTITVPPGSEAWYPAFTNGRLASVIAEGLIVGALPQTLVLFSNTFMSPFSASELPQSVQLLKASPAIQQGVTFYNSNFATPSIGDQVWTGSSTGIIGGDTLFPFTHGLQTSGFYFVKAISMEFVIFNSNNVSSAVGSASFNDHAGNNKWLLPYAISFAAVPVISESYVLSMSGMDVKLDATRQWYIDIAGNEILGTNGIFSVNICYTYNPLNP